jgi:hypothetical protein
MASKLDRAFVQIVAMPNVKKYRTAKAAWGEVLAQRSTLRSTLEHIVEAAREAIIGRESAAEALRRIQQLATDTLKGERPRAGKRAA